VLARGASWVLCGCLLASCDAGAPGRRDAAPDDDAGAVGDDVRSPEDAPTFYDAPVEDATPHDGTFPDARMPSACDGAPGRSLSVLFVGNSQIDFWNMARLVSSISESAPPGCPRVVGTKHTMGGANLRDLWERTDLASNIATGGYDAVVITESIDLADMRPPFPELFDAYARRVVEATRAAGAVPLFYATGYVETPTRFGFAEMADPQLALGAELGVPVATGGLAWLRAWERLPELDLYHPDRGHPGYVGSYLSALVLWGTLLASSPIGLTNAPATDCTDGPCLEISPALAAELQAVADEELRAR
jgi:hypothetical protein